MPELPEVETVKNTLKLNILNKKIIDVKVNYSKIIQNVSEEDFINKLKNQSFIDILRKGKHLIFVLNDYYLIGHMRMEGKYFLMHEEEINKHDHIIFEFEDSNLRYNDTRKFGTMFLYEKDIDIYNVKPLSNVGYEPFEEGMTKEYLYSKIGKLNKAIKTVLLDQSIISGLGNIYVDEVLFMSGLHPETKANLLDLAKCEEIIKNSIIVLNKAIKLGGTTIRSFQSSHDISGRFQNELLVHTKEICPNCNLKIKKIRVGGRGTYVCENCQKICLQKN